MADAPQRPDRDALARMLAEARKRLAGLDLPAGVAARLHRQFIAVCDAMKAAGADESAGQRRLAAFLTTLDQVAARNTGYRSRNDNSKP
jgi:hypothetical protein